MKRDVPKQSCKNVVYLELFNDGLVYKSDQKKINEMFIIHKRLIIMWLKIKYCIMERVNAV